MHAMKYPSFKKALSGASLLHFGKYIAALERHKS
jgi:hypothetical protein